MSDLQLENFYIEIFLLSHDNVLSKCSYTFLLLLLLLLLLLKEYSTKMCLGSCP